jgi:hypothetical protein
MDVLIVALGIQVIITMIPTLAQEPGYHILSLQHESYDQKLNELNTLSDEVIRKMVFDWCEERERCNDVDETVFRYTEEDVLKHKELQLPVFKKI